MADFTPEPGAADEDTSRTANSAGAASNHPPTWIWILLVICAVLIVAIRVSNATGDFAVDNLLSLIIGFIAVATIYIWFCFRSMYPLSIRRWVMVAGILPLMVALACFRIGEVSGDVVPRLVLRWSKNADQLLDHPPGELTRSVDLSTTSADDFGQFLGPARDMRSDNVSLSDDWKAASPREMWKQPIGAGWSGFVVVGDVAVTMEQRDELEMVTCYDRATGELVWWDGVETRHATVLGGVGPRSTPTIHAGRVYAMGATGYLRCLDGATGTPFWNRNVLDDVNSDLVGDLKVVAWGRAASPLIVGDNVIVPAGGPPLGPFVSLIAYDAATGDEVWRGGKYQITYASPSLATLAGVPQILIVNEGFATAHDPTTGDVLWEHPWPSTSNADALSSQAVALPDDQVLLTKGYNAGAVLLNIRHNADGSWSADEVWANPRVLKTKLTNVVIHNGHAYALSDGILECARLSDGIRQWKRGRYGHGQILGVRDRLLVLSQQGELLLADADPTKLTVRGRLQALEGKTWNNLCLSGRYLLVRNAQQAACYEMKESE